MDGKKNETISFRSAENKKTTAHHGSEIFGHVIKRDGPKRHTIKESVQAKRQDATRCTDLITKIPGNNLTHFTRQAENRSMEDQNKERSLKSRCLKSNTRLRRSFLLLLSAVGHRDRMLTIYRVRSRILGMTGRMLGKSTAFFVSVLRGKNNTLFTEMNVSDKKRFHCISTVPFPSTAVIGPWNSTVSH